MVIKKNRSLFISKCVLVIHSVSVHDFFFILNTYATFTKYLHDMYTDKYMWLQHTKMKSLQLFTPKEKVDILV